MIVPFLFGAFLLPIFTGEEVNLFFADGTEVMVLTKTKSTELSESDLVDKMISGVQIIDQNITLKFRLVAGLLSQLFAALTSIFMSVGILICFRKKLQEDMKKVDDLSVDYGPPPEE